MAPSVPDEGKFVLAQQIDPTKSPASLARLHQLASGKTRFFSIARFKWRAPYFGSCLREQELFHLGRAVEDELVCACAIKTRC